MSNILPTRPASSPSEQNGIKAEIVLSLEIWTGWLITPSISPEPTNSAVQSTLERAEWWKEELTRPFFLADLMISQTRVPGQVRGCASEDGDVFVAQVHQAAGFVKHILCSVEMSSHHLLIWSR